MKAESQLGGKFSRAMETWPSYITRGMLQG
jgi:hypothetical protein